MFGQANKALGLLKHSVLPHWGATCSVLKTSAGDSVFRAIVPCFLVLHVQLARPAGQLHPNHTTGASPPPMDLVEARRPKRRFFGGSRRFPT